MPELFLELFGEEIPARMQSGAAAELARLVVAALAPLQPVNAETFYGPRRIAFRADVNANVGAATTVERGPRLSAPEQALTGFLRKHGAGREALRQEGEYWVLEKTAPAVPATLLIAETLPPLLRRFHWPKSMRWGGSSSFTWVRPLRRIVCLLDGDVVPFDLRDGPDDGHGLRSADLTEGHRFHAPGAFPVRSCADWRDKLAEHYVLVDAAERRGRIARGLQAEAAARQLDVVEDAGLLDEATGLVEWPVPLLGRIDPAFMDLPPEVMQVSMRVNQRDFALRMRDGRTASWFGFVANIEADDGGAAIIAGNERVLRARFADARHFWDLDRRIRLATRVPLLDQVTFHAKLGTQGDRVRRLRHLARTIAPLVGANPGLADRAAELAKADLVSGMVGEFPELQGVMGRYYALHDGEPAEVADAIRDHYAPRGPNEAAPDAPVSMAVAMADKLDQLVAFFSIGEQPTGSADPFALRRAALGLIRIIREGRVRLHLRPLIAAAATDAAVEEPLLRFITERLIVALRAEGTRHDTVAAVFGGTHIGAGGDDDITDLLARAEAVSAFLATDDGADLLVAYRRAANILRIEERKDGAAFDLHFDNEILVEPSECDLAEILDAISPRIETALDSDNFHAAMTAMAGLRHPLDAFFDHVTVNAPEPELRRNRLRLLAAVRDTMNRVADFSKIEG